MFFSQHLSCSITSYYSIPGLSDCIDRVRVLGTIKIKKNWKKCNLLKFFQHLSCRITSYNLLFKQCLSKAMGGTLKVTFAHFLLAFQLRLTFGGFFQKRNYSLYYFKNNVNNSFFNKRGDKDSYSLRKFHIVINKCTCTDFDRAYWTTFV